jgi:hypothetical protein
VLRTNIDRDETADHVVRFQGVEFSEWLAMTCYGQIAGSLRKYNRELGVDLERYLMAMYLTGNRPWKKEGRSTLTLSLQYSTVEFAPGLSNITTSSFVSLLFAAQHSLRLITSYDASYGYAGGALLARSHHSQH